MQKRFLIGVIEGFYGRQWPMQSRVNYRDYLVALGLNTYIYAPKGDACLRREWQRPWSAEQGSALSELAAHYRAGGLEFGVGLSPFALYRRYGAEERRLLAARIEEIRGTGASLVSILFDDMPGDLDSLAARQADILADVCSLAGDLRVQVCPTYYSFDPVLEKHFGAMPEKYWQDLGAAMPAEVDIYWTGNRVCSETVSVDDIRAIAAALGRPVLLWDNYPVNDGAIRSRRLYCQPLSGRESGLGAELTGHLCNPMNQPLLSLPALQGLARLYGLGPGDEAVRNALGEQAWLLLQQYQQTFQEQGLDAIEPSRREEIAREFERAGGGAAAEVAGWLRGEYTFDPACLTD